jgi:DivIVA domain-containing protein
MGITVSDIERKEFAYKGAGYDPYDVDQYLDQICDEMVAMQDRIVQLEKEL